MRQISLKLRVRWTSSLALTRSESRSTKNPSHLFALNVGGRCWESWYSITFISGLSKAFLLTSFLGKYVTAVSELCASKFDRCIMSRKLLQPSRRTTQRPRNWSKVSLSSPNHTYFRTSPEIILNPLHIARNENEQVLIEPSINSIRISIKIKQADEIERILAHKLTRFFTGRAESFIILRRKPMPVKHLRVGRWLTWFRGMIFRFWSPIFIRRRCWSIN